jgi:uncharacterized OB-fold protein
MEGIGATILFGGGLKNGILLYTTCTKCGKKSLPPRLICDHCGSPEYELKEVQERKGMILASTTIHVPPSHIGTSEPYTIVVFEFPNGLRLMGRLNPWLEENLAGRVAEILIDKEKGEYSFRLL